MAFVEIIDEYKRYKMGDTIISANDGISFEIEQGEFAVIVGPSGAGKSTVLNILGGMDQADEGKVKVDGINIAEFSRKQLTKYRRDDVVGLGERLDNFPAQLSGGEQQRVAIARALAKQPKLLLCDEPTGALDYETGKQILKLLKDTCENTGTTVIVITHNQAIAPMADRIIEINNAKVRKMTLNPHPSSVADIEW